MLKYCLIVAALVCTAVRADEPAEKRPAQNVGGIADAPDTGAITGGVYFKGEKPEPKPITEIAGNAFCKEHHKDHPPLRDTFVFGKNGERDTVQNVLVYVSAGLEEKQFDPPEAPAVLDQVGCIYTPHVVAVMVGQPLEVRNSDATLHNVMSTPRVNPPFNFGMPVQGGKSKLQFNGAEMKINTKCFMHPWMSAYIHVLEHPFFAVTGKDGTFTIKGLPPGEYELSVLHESSMLVPTPETATVKVEAGKTSNGTDFTFEVRKDD